MRELQIWAKPLVNNEYALLVYNAGTKDHDITAGWFGVVCISSFHSIPFTEFKLLNPEWESKVLMLRDVWAHSDLGAMRLNYTVRLPSHGVSVTRVSLSSA